jgi:hypothetical protein
VIKLRNSEASEQGASDAIFVVIMLPILLIGLLGVGLTILYRQVIEQPLPGILASYTQQFAAYGSNDIPLYGRTGRFTTVEEGMKQSFILSGRVKDNDPNNIDVTCGPLNPDGSVNRGGVVFANSAVGCNAVIQVKSWPFRSLIPGLPERLFGGVWVGVSTAYSDRGANPNLL